MTPTSPAVNLGFLTILHEATGYVGGYLVTNLWGRPLEFRLSSAVQPNRVQQILYGPTLQPYVHGELIGRTLIEKTATPAALVITDRPAVLDVRVTLDLPVAWIVPPEDTVPADAIVLRSAEGSRGALVLPARFAADTDRVGEVLAGVEAQLDLSEPFARIREAMAEARKLGVMRSAG